MIDSLFGMYNGTVQKVITPEDPNNTVGGYQYQYIVSVVVGSSYSGMDCPCIVMDSYGSPKDFEDKILEVGNRVFVQFPRGDRSMGVIIGGPRTYTQPQTQDDGKYAQKRYRQVTVTHDQNGTYSVVSDSGPNLIISKTSITIDDSQGEKIVLDTEAKTLTIEAGDTTETLKSWTVNISGDAKVTADSVAITANGKATVDAQTIELNGPAGMVITTDTQPTCYVSGIPFIGSTTVKAGS